MVSRKERSRIDERIGREAETLALFVKYRSTHMGVQIYNYHECLHQEIPRIVKPLSYLAYGQIRIAYVKDEFTKNMDDLVTFLEETGELRGSPALLNLLMHLHDNYCRERSYHLKKAIARAALAIYESRDHPMYLALLVKVFHSSVWGMTKYFDAVIHDMLLQRSSDWISKIMQSSTIRSFEKEDELSTSGREIFIADRSGRSRSSDSSSQVSVESTSQASTTTDSSKVSLLNDPVGRFGWFPGRIIVTVLVLLVGLPLYPLKILVDQDARGYLLAPIRLQWLSFRRRHALLDLGTSHPLCSKKAFALSMISVLIVDTLYFVFWFAVAKLRNSTAISSADVFNDIGAALLITLSLNAFLIYLAVNPHRRPRGNAVIYWLYLLMMRMYLALSVVSFSLACYTLHLKQKVVNANDLDIFDGHAEQHVIYIALALFTWLLLFVVNAAGYLYYKFNRITFSPLFPQDEQSRLTTESTQY